MSTIFLQLFVYVATRGKKRVISTYRKCLRGGRELIVLTKKGRTGEKEKKLLQKASISPTCASRCSLGQYENPA